MTPPNTNSLAREAAAQYLYQCDCEKIYYFSEGSFGMFLENFTINDQASQYCRELVNGVFTLRVEIDAALSAAAKNWKLERMGATDRNILRVAVYELMTKSEPPKVVVNEAIELAKRFGSEFSAKFVNGVLDGIAFSGAEVSAVPSS